MRSALLVRQSFLDLRDNFRRIVDPPLLSYDGKGTVFYYYCCCFLGFIGSLLESHQLSSFYCLVQISLKSSE